MMFRVLRRIGKFSVVSRRTPNDKAWLQILFVRNDSDIQEENSQLLSIVIQSPPILFELNMKLNVSILMWY